jgi:hypothetical protein
MAELFRSISNPFIILSTMLETDYGDYAVCAALALIVIAGCFLSFEKYTFSWMNLIKILSIATAFGFWFFLYHGSFGFTTKGSFKVELASMLAVMLAASFTHWVLVFHHAGAPTKLFFFPAIWMTVTAFVLRHTF